MIAHVIHALPELSGGEFKRATFYFPTGDEIAAAEYLDMPDHSKPGEVRDIHFKFCGTKLKRTAGLAEFVETVPPKWRDHFNKSEKGIDIEMCCDALKLASAGRIERLFFLTNDDDFIPFFRTLKEFGANISVIHLSDVVSKNASLLREADSYDVISMAVLDTIFLQKVAPPQETVGTPDNAPEVTVEESKVDNSSALKPEAEPSDLESVSQATEQSETPAVESEEPKAKH
jgi:uncharacterized LabA/DUF88 family protein